MTTRFNAKIIQLQLKGHRVGHVLFHEHETVYSCPRCRSLETIPPTHPIHLDAWGSCATCGQVAVFELSEDNYRTHGEVAP